MPPIVAALAAALLLLVGGHSEAPARTTTPAYTTARTTQPAHATASVAPTTAAAATVAPAAAVPGTPDFPAWIEPAASFEPENTCDPTPKPGALEVQRILAATYGSGIASNISRACSDHDSGHEEGRAIDWMASTRVPAQKAMAEAFLGWLLATDEHGNAYAMARRLGVMYIIYDSRKLYLWNTAAGWTEYSDCLTVSTAPSQDNTCHRNHVHISLAWAGARAQTSWYTLAGGLPSCTTPAGAPEHLLTPTGAARGVTPATVLDTARGIGTPRSGLPCEMPASGSVRVAATGGAVRSGAAEVTLTVRTAAATSNTWVALAPSRRAAPAGRAAAAAPRLDVAAGHTGTATWTVRLGPSGSVWLAVGPAGPALQVSVTAYRPAVADVGPPRATGPTVSIAAPGPTRFRRG